VKAISGLFRGSFVSIWVATALFAFGGVVAPSSLSQASLLSMLPYAAILAVVAAGQTLVAQQGGIDLSIPSMISLGALLVTKIPDQSTQLVFPAILIAVAACAFVGAVNGLCVALGRITPIVATIGVNALLLGFIQWYSSGFPTPVAQFLGDWAVGRFLTVPNTVICALAIVTAIQVAIAKTVAGRRFEAVGANRTAAAAANIRVSRYVVAGYAGAGVCYAMGGVLLDAGHLCRRQLSFTFGRGRGPRRHCVDGRARQHCCDRSSCPVPYAAWAARSDSWRADVRTVGHPSSDHRTWDGLA
jgi:ribose transport system permease protein